MSTFKRAKERLVLLPSASTAKARPRRFPPKRFFLGFSLKIMNSEKKGGEERGQRLKNKTTTTLKTFI